MKSVLERSVSPTSSLYWVLARLQRVLKMRGGYRRASLMGTDKGISTLSEETTVWGHGNSRIGSTQEHTSLPVEKRA